MGATPEVRVLCRLGRSACVRLREVLEIEAYSTRCNLFATFRGDPLVAVRGGWYLVLRPGLKKAVSQNLKAL